jgi:hypothetical protein
MTGSAKPITLLSYTSAVTNYRRNFICGGSFFFTANLAERRLRLLVDDIVSAKDDGFRCRSTHPTGLALRKYDLAHSSVFDLALDKRSSRRSSPRRLWLRQRSIVLQKGRTNHFPSNVLDGYSHK